MKKTFFALCLVCVCLTLFVSCQSTDTTGKSAEFDHSGEFVNPNGTYICRTSMGYSYLILDSQNGKAIYNGKTVDYTKEGSMLSFKSGNKQYALEICNVDNEHHELVRVSRGILVRFYPLGYYLAHFPTEPRFFTSPAISGKPGRKPVNADKPVQKQDEPAKAATAVEKTNTEAKTTDIPETIVVTDDKAVPETVNPQGSAQYQFEQHRYVNDGTGWKEVPSEQGNFEQHMYVFDGNQWKEVPVNN